jgi:hypothetical protein
MSKQKITIIILAVSLFLLSEYLLIEKLEDSKQEELVDMYQQGYDDGIADTIAVIFQQTENCKVSTITANNFSKNIFDASCLQESSP